MEKIKRKIILNSIIILELLVIFNLIVACMEKELEEATRDKFPNLTKLENEILESIKDKNIKKLALYLDSKVHFTTPYYSEVFYKDKDILKLNDESSFFYCYLFNLAPIIEIANGGSGDYAFQSIRDSILASNEIISGDSSTQGYTTPGTRRLIITHKVKEREVDYVERTSVIWLKCSDINDCKIDILSL